MFLFAFCSLVGGDGKRKDFIFARPVSPLRFQESRGNKFQVVEEEEEEVPTLTLGSWMATPSTETVSSTLGVRWPSALRSCCEKRSLRMPSLTTSMPFGWSTSVLPKN